jgi:low temperature requirement protein LtrA
MVIAVMVAGLFMNASLARAFDDASWLFVATFLAIQLGRTGWMLTTPLDPTNREHFVATFVWLAATAPVWIAGAAASANVRLGLWGAAAAIDLIGIWLAHPLFRRRLRSERAEFAGEHLIERCKLFLLIALGETVATPGAALATAPIDAQTLAGGALALAGTLCLWWLYFHAEPLALRHVARTKDRVYASRMGTNGLLFMIAGLIALAAGNALVIRQPSREATLAVALMLSGGPGIFLLARAWYQRRVFAATPWPQLVTIAALAATVAAVPSAPALVAQLTVVGVLAALVIVEQFTDTDGSLRGPSITRSRRSATAEDWAATGPVRAVGRVGDAT